jgi:hypothetical protein
MSRSPDNSPPIDFLAAPPGPPSGKADGFVGRDEAASAGSIISGENRVNEGMPFILCRIVPNGNWLLATGYPKQSMSPLSSASPTC